MNDRQRQLVKDHTEWAMQIGTSIHGSICGGKGGSINACDLEDFRQMGLYGLVTVVTLPISKGGYDHTKGTFKAYAYKRISGFVRDRIREADELPRNHRDEGVQGATMSLDHPAVASDDERVDLLKDLLESPRQRDRAEVHEALRWMLQGLSPATCAIVYLVRAQELPAASVAAIMGLEIKEVADLLEHATSFIEARKTLLPGTRRRVAPAGDQPKNGVTRCNPRTAAKENAARPANDGPGLFSGSSEKTPA